MVNFSPWRFAFRYRLIILGVNYKVGLRMIAGGTQLRCLAHLCMLLLVISSLQEQGSDLLKSILLSLRCIVGVLISCHGLACKGSFQILFGLSTGVLIRKEQDSVALPFLRVSTQS